MKVLICGSRNWNNKRSIRKQLDKIVKGANPLEQIVHGACRGADLLSEELAKEMEIDYRGYPAKWSVHGRSAGPIRNQKMLDEEDPDLVLAFHEDIRKSKGTWDLVKRAREARVKVVLVSK
jgi:hypothetical protein